jgi:hypothetical protein
MYHKITQEWGMFSPEGNELVSNIVDAAKRLHITFGDNFEQTGLFALRALERLSYGEGYGEATDTAVRESVYCELERFYQEREHVGVDSPSA